MEEKIQGRVALVTGVGRAEGIGTAICRELAQNGADIFFTYWSAYDKEVHSETDHEDAPRKLREELIGYGVKCEYEQFDLSSGEDLNEVFGCASEKVGVPDILINNACCDTEIPFVDLTPEILDKHYAVNVRAVTMLCKEIAKQKKKADIINMTSGQSLGSMGEDKIPYTITKAASEMLAKQLAPDLSEYDITINSLDPGPVDTGWMNDELREILTKESPRGRISTQEDVAKRILSIIADEDVTGEVIHVER